MIDVVEPEPGVRYHALAWRGAPDMVRPMIAVIGALVGYLAVFSIIGSGLLRIGHALWGRGAAWDTYYRQAIAFERPEGMVAAHLAIAALIPLSLLVCRYGLGLRPGWLCSVQGRVRWGYLGLCFAVSLVVFNIAVWLLQRISPGALHPQDRFWLFLVIIVLTSPLQAAAEEFFFRGLLLTCLGTLTPNRWVGIVGSALIFALFHGLQNGWLFADRFVFGLLAGYLAVRTGGLEAGIAAHVANNLCAFIYAALTTGVAVARTTTQVTWSSALADVGIFAVVALVLAALAQARRLPAITADTSNLALRPAVR